MNEDVRIAAVRRDETEAAVFEVVSNNSCRHLSISCCLPCTAGCCERSTSGRPVPAEATKHGGHGFVGGEMHPTNANYRAATQTNGERVELPEYGVICEA